MISGSQKHTKIPFQLSCLSGRVPVDPRLTQCLEEGRNYVEAFSGAPAQTSLAEIVSKIIIQLEGGTSGPEIPSQDVRTQ